MAEEIKLYNTKILSTGVYLPETIRTNFDLEKMVDTSDQWIYERTGIKQRRISKTDGTEFPSDMAVKASLNALKEANLTPNDIDLILVATCTPDYKLPNTASVIQTKLGITNKCGCLDIAAACSGFVYGLNMANALIRIGEHKNVLMIGSEMLSSQTDWEDRNSCILFGDGCGVAILGRAESDESAILSTCLGADGTGKPFFEQPVGGCVHPATHEELDNRNQFMQMQGREMFKVATRTLAQNVKDLAEKANISIDDIDWLVPHQANVRIIETTGKLLGMDPNKVIVNIENYGNNSAATIPIAFHESVKSGKIKRGDVVAFDAFGAGLTSGGTLLRY